MSARQFRKKPIVIEATQWTGGDTEDLAAFAGSRNWARADAVDVPWTHPDLEQVVIWNELEQSWIPAPVGSWIIRGVKGEYYPCASDVFEATYEPVTA